MPLLQVGPILGSTRQFYRKKLGQCLQPGSDVEEEEEGGEEEGRDVEGGIYEDDEDEFEEEEEQPSAIVKATPPGSVPPPNVVFPRYDLGTPTEAAARRGQAAAGTGLFWASLTYCRMSG